MFWDSKGIFQRFFFWREEVEKECLEVLMTLDAEFGLQAAHYEDQVMLEKAL